MGGVDVDKMFVLFSIVGFDIFGLDKIFRLKNRSLRPLISLTWTFLCPFGGLNRRIGCWKTFRIKLCGDWAFLWLGVRSKPRVNGIEVDRRFSRCGAASDFFLYAFSSLWWLAILRRDKPRFLPKRPGRVSRLKIGDWRSLADSVSSACRQ